MHRDDLCCSELSRVGSPACAAAWSGVAGPRGCCCPGLAADARPGLVEPARRPVGPAGVVHARSASPLYLRRAARRAGRGVVRRRDGRGRSRSPPSAVAGLAAARWWWFAPMVTGANPPAPDGRRAAAGDDREPVRRAGPTGSRWSSGDRGGRRPAGRARDHRRSCWPDGAGGPRRACCRHRAGDRPEARAGDDGLRRRGRSSDADRASTPRWGGWRVTMGDLTVLGGAPARRRSTPAGGAATTPRSWPRPTRPTPDLVVGDLNATIDHEPMRRPGRRGLPLGHRARQRGLAADLAGATAASTCRRRRCRAWCRSTTSWSALAFAALGTPHARRSRGPTTARWWRRWR